MRKIAGKEIIMINWKIRIKNRSFWTALIPAVLILIQMIAKVFNYELNLTELGTNLINVVNSAFVVLTILGIVIDPTTEGIGDSIKALNYEKPKSDTDPLNYGGEGDYIKEETQEKRDPADDTEA